MQPTRIRVSGDQILRAPSAWLSGEEHGALAPLLDLGVTQTHSQGAYLYLFDPREGVARRVLWCGLPPDDGETEPIPEASIPALDFRRQSPIILTDAAAGDVRFQGLTEFHKYRFAGVASIPLIDSGLSVGLMNICRVKPVPLQPQELTFLLSLSLPIAGLVASAVSQRRLREEVERLSRQLADRKIIERAKGLLQVRFGWSEEQAYLAVRRFSRQRRIPMRDVAQRVIATSGLLLSDVEFTAEGPRPPSAPFAATAGPRREGGAAAHPTENEALG